MKTGYRIFTVICLSLTIFACAKSQAEENPGSPTQSPTLTTPDQTAVPVTDTPAAEEPTDTALNEEAIMEIIRASLSSFPWRLEQTVLLKETGQTQTTLTEAQSSRRGYNRSVQTVNDATITVESTLLDSTFYLKITGSPAETYGLVSGEWKEIAPDSPLAQLIDTGAIDPAQVSETFAADFASIGGTDEMTFQVVGDESLNGVQTNIYEAKGETFTYRWWIGADGRFYKSTVEIPEATRTLIMEYDAGITIQAPIP